MNATVISSTRIGEAFDIHVIPLRFALRIDDIGKIRLGKLASMLLILGRIVLRCVSRRPSVAYFTLAPAGGALIRDLLYLSVFRVFSVRTVLHIHGRGLELGSVSDRSRSFLRWALRDCVVIRLSESLNIDLASFVTGEGAQVLPNGIEDQFGSRDPRLSARPTILFLSNMLPEKGPFDLLRALAPLATQFEFRALFAGEAGYPEFESDFSEALDELHLRHCVEWSGPVFGARKRKLLEEADIFAFPTYYLPEGLPLVLLEAMSASLPVVATTQGAIADVVVDGVTGFLVPPRDPAALSERIRQLMLDSSMRERFGLAARERYIRLYTQDRFEEGLLRILYGACGRESADDMEVLETRASA